MNRTQALDVLHLDDASDSHAVESSYWTLVRHAQSRSPDETTAAREVERLNAAYAALAPSPTLMTRAPRKSTAAPARAQTQAASRASTSENAFDAALDWIAAEAARVRKRWAGRNAEVALIAGAAVALAVVGIAAGTSVVVVLICLAVMAAGVWCPWRSAGSSDDEDGP